MALPSSYAFRLYCRHYRYTIFYSASGWVPNWVFVSVQYVCVCNTDIAKSALIYSKSEPMTLGLQSLGMAEEPLPARTPTLPDTADTEVFAKREALTVDTMLKS